MFDIREFCSFVFIESSLLSHLSIPTIVAVTRVNRLWSFFLFFFPHLHFVGTHYSFVVRFSLFVCECRQEEQVQTLVAEISGYRSAIQSALPCLLIMFWGKWCGGCVVVDILGVGDDDFITDTVQNERNEKMYVSEVWPFHYLFSSRMQSRRDARILSNMSDRISSNQKAEQFSCSDLYRLCKVQIAVAWQQFIVCRHLFSWKCLGFVWGTGCNGPQRPPLKFVYTWIRSPLCLHPFIHLSWSICRNEFWQ